VFVFNKVSPEFLFPLACGGMELVSCVC